LKVIATKLDNNDYEKFNEICNEEGNSKSEELRKIVRDFIDANKELDESEIEEEPKPIVRLVADVPDHSDKPVWEVEI